ncbi:hypothetical protein BSNK01_24160 [Bacillaceae bacterium]
MSTLHRELLRLRGQWVQARLKDGKVVRGKLMKVGKDHLVLGVRNRRRKTGISSRGLLPFRIPFSSLFFLFPFFFFRRRRFIFF